MNIKKTQTAIIGGGLAGMLAALRLAQGGCQVTLIDHSLPQAEGQLGGFAKFSGAKFSLPPAGLGLVPVAGSIEKLEINIREVWAALGLSEVSVLGSCDKTIGGAELLDTHTILRKYSSAVLTPNEIDELVRRLTDKIVKSVSLIKAEAIKLEKCIDGWQVHLAKNGQNIELITADAVFYAAGRLSTEILLNAGALPADGKGIDLGLRVEFKDKLALHNLRAMGADAKIINKNCRTFCLNSPGLIYRYPFRNFSIPGGVVADECEKRANVGLLVRVRDKTRTFQQVVNNCSTFYKEVLLNSEEWITSSPLGNSEKLIASIYGDEVLSQLSSFAAILHESKMIDWSMEHKIHLPLIDWHWDVFCGASSHRTTLDGVYALGDSAGHARGLMQAGLSGWIAAEEYLNAKPS